MECVYNKLLTVDKKCIRIYVNLQNDVLEIVLLHNDQSWKSIVAKEKLSFWANEHKLSYEDYCLKLLNFIKSPDDVNFTFNDSEFGISRFVESNKLLKIKFFVCTLEKVNYIDGTETILDNFHTFNQSLLSRLNVISSENTSLTSSNTSLEKSFEDLKSSKKQSEEQLFSNFILVLNEKKRRIQHLTEQLHAYQTGGPSTNVPIKNKAKNIANKPNIQKREMISESDSSDYETDDSSKTVTKMSPLNTSSPIYDLLNDEESAKATNLPKRMKIDPPINEKPIHPHTKLVQENINETTEHMQQIENNDEPAIDYNTQQLLDML